MRQAIGYICLLVRDYDEAIRFFTHALGFDLIDDSPSTDREGRKKRWVLIAPPGAKETKILLAKASGPEETARIGNQTGGRVFLSLHTDDFERDYQALTKKGVKFTLKPTEQWGVMQAKFVDPDGNEFSLVEG